MDTKNTSLYIAILLSIVSLIVCCIGLFTDNWWIDEKNQHHDIFTVVSCLDHVCTLAAGGSDAWIVSVQVFGLLELSMLIATTCTQGVMMILSDVRQGRLCSTIGLVSVGIACGASMLQIFIVSGKYHATTNAYMRTEVIPAGRVLYNSLSSGLCAISGIISIPVVISLILWRIQNKTIFEEEEQRRILINKIKANRKLMIMEMLKNPKWQTSF